MKKWTKSYWKDKVKLINKNLWFNSFSISSAFTSFRWRLRLIAFSIINLPFVAHKNKASITEAFLQKIFKVAEKDYSKILVIAQEETNLQYSLNKTNFQNKDMKASLISLKDFLEQRLINSKDYKLKTSKLAKIENSKLIA
jgi:hypothetical protein